MLHAIVEDPDTEPSAALDAYRSTLAATLDAAPDRDGVSPETVTAIESGSVADLTLEAAASVLALDSDAPTAEVILAEARDDLLLTMSTAVVDVDRVAADLDGLTPRDVQQKVEGRAATTLAEYAAIRHAIGS